MLTLKVVVFLICTCTSTGISGLSISLKTEVVKKDTLKHDVVESVPYIVSIQFKKFDEWQHLCAGSIISPNYILTAAHCFYPYFYNYKLKAFRILAGTSDLTDTKNGSIHDIVYFKSHPEYDNEFNGHDIGLLRIQPSFEFNGTTTISKIGFESSESVMGDVPVVFHGWGLPQYVNELREVNLTTMSYEACKSEGLPGLAKIDICAIGGVLDGGDSGGPLVNEERNLQIGICSYSAMGKNPNHSYPFVFTRVSVFVEWIKNIIERKEVMIGKYKVIIDH